MSAPKYQPVPARDSFEEPPASANYNQNAPPPSYQQEPVMGEARDEEDNLPDDFKVRTTTSYDGYSTPAFKRTTANAAT